MSSPEKRRLVSRPVTVMGTMSRGGGRVHDDADDGDDDDDDDDGDDGGAIAVALGESGLMGDPVQDKECNKSNE